MAREGYIDVEGGHVYFRVEGNGPGLPLVVLHGGPGVSHEYLLSLGALGDQRPVVFYDQLGCGLSDRPDDGALWSVERFVRELAEVRRALALADIHLLGHSWGTMLAVDYALYERDGIRSVTLANPSLDVKRWAQDADTLIAALPASERDAIDRHRAAGTFDSPEYQRAAFAYSRRHLCRLDPWPEVMLTSSTPMNRRLYTAMWGPTDFEATGVTRNYDRTGELHRLTMPVLFMTGRYDTATPETTVIYARHTPRAEMVVFEESSHLPHIEEPEAFLRSLRDFLRRSESVTTRPEPSGVDFGLP
jgi:proline iminopeptidase